MPTPTAAERLHAQQQKNRKAAGLPDPSEYKKKLDSMKSEEVEHIDESVLKTVKRVFQGWGNDPQGTGTKPKDIVKRNKEHSPETSKKLLSNLGDAKPHTPAGLQKKVLQRNLKSEEVEQLDEISSQLKASYVAGAKKQIKQSMPFTKKSDEYRDIAKNFIAKRQKGIDKASKVEEQLEKKGRFVSGPIKQPFKSNTIVTSVKEAKDSHEYDYEGEMALNQLDTIMRHAEYLKDMIKPDTNLPEWVQAKITLAADYIQTSCDYLTSEMNEETIQEDADPCWKGYKMVGMKNKNGRKVPNCVPGEGVPSMKKEDAANPTEGEMKGKQQGVSRKAQIVRDAAKGKKSDNPDKFQKDPELSSEIHKT